MTYEDEVTGNGDVAATETAEEAQDFAGTVSKLEKIIRGMGRDSLAIVRSQKDVESHVQTILTRLDDLELLTKGVAQTAWRAAQEHQGHLHSTQEHFAGAIRELEARVRDEMQWHFRRSMLDALCPALDDLDLIIGAQQLLTQNANEKDRFLEALILVRKKIVAGLKVLGLEEIVIEEGVTRFDPELHEAAESDIPDELRVSTEVAPGTIVRVRRAGYCYNGRVIRVPQVFVAAQATEHR